MIKVTEIEDLPESLKKKCKKLYRIVEIYPDYASKEEEKAAQDNMFEMYARYCLEHPD